MKSLHKRLFKAHSSFGYAAVCGLIIGIGDLIATGTDIYWLIGDMSIQTHFHHYPVLIGLLIAELIMIASFIWLYRAIYTYLNKKDKKRIELDQCRNRRRLAANYSNVNPKRVITNNYINYVPDLSEN